MGKLDLKEQDLTKIFGFFSIVTLFHILQQVYIIEAQNRNVVFAILMLYCMNLVVFKFV